MRSTPQKRRAAIFATAMLVASTGDAALAFGSDSPAFGPALGEADLRDISGGKDLSLAALSEQTGTVSHNSVNGTSVTGTINFDGQAFQNMNGLAVVSANTGNNVSINSTMQVNIAIGAAP